MVHVGRRAAAAVRGRSHGVSWDRRDTAAPRLIVFATVVLLSLFALPAQAQGPSTLQVSARVVPTGPSREALSAALQPGLGAASSPLAQIRHDLESGTTDSLGIARRPRTIVTIAFLRN
ncbi:MAG: hypothetical protein ABI587_03935 [Gemmatimonadales bacterium]